MVADFERMQREFNRASAEFVHTELELAATFLDLAAITVTAEHSQRCVRDAELAVRTAERVMKHLRFPEGVNASLLERRQQLGERLRDYLRKRKKSEIAEQEAHWPGVWPPPPDNTQQ